MRLLPSPLLRLNATSQPASGSIILLLLACLQYWDAGLLSPVPPPPFLHSDLQVVNMFSTLSFQAAFSISCCPDNPAKFHPTYVHLPFFLFLFSSCFSDSPVKFLPTSVLLPFFFLLRVILTTLLSATRFLCSFSSVSRCTGNRIKCYPNSVHPFFYLVLS